MSDDQCDKDVECDLIRVSGSGITHVNGRFTLKGHFNGAPMFENDHGIVMVRYLVFGRPRWYIGQSARSISSTGIHASKQPTEPTEYYAVDSADPTPPIHG